MTIAETKETNKTKPNGKVEPNGTDPKFITKVPTENTTLTTKATLIISRKRSGSHEGTAMGLGDGNVEPPPVVKPR